MGKTKRHIYFLCPDVQWDSPATGGLLYNFVLIKALKQKYGDGSVIPLNLMETCCTQSWVQRRIISNWKYIVYFWKGSTDLILVDSRSNSMLLAPLVFLRYFSKATIGMTVYHINYSLSRRHGVVGIIEKYCEKLFIRCASFIVTNSRSTLHGITQLAGRTEFGKVSIKIIPPGVNTEKVLAQGLEDVEKRSSVLKLLYVGTCEDPRKGLDYLIRAVADLSYPNFKLYLVGKYDRKSVYHRHLAQLVENYNLRHKIFFLGRVSDDELYQLYRKSDIFVFPSLWEGYGIVLAEAMAHGLPIVSTNVSAIPEIVSHGENGLLVAPGSVEALTEALAELVNNDELRHRMAANSLEIANTFKSWDEVGQVWTELVEHSFLD